MSDELSSPFQRLWWPERAPISEHECTMAVTWITQAQAAGLITEEQADRRRAQLLSARTREDLRALLGDLPGAVTPTGLLTTSRVITLVWLGVSLVNFAVWVLILMFGGDLAPPWWLWPTAVGGLVAAGVWWMVELDHRSRYVREGSRSHA